MATSTETRTMSEIDYDFVKKQMILNRLCLPKDIIDNEIKNYCFPDKLSGKAMKVRKNVNCLIKQACSRANGFGDGETDDSNTTTHWAFGFTTDVEKTQLQAVNCYRCGNYMIFNNMYNMNGEFNVTNVLCNCWNHGW